MDSKDSEDIQEYEKGDDGNFDVTKLELTQEKLASMSTEELRKLKQKLRGLISSEITEKLKENPSLLTKIFKRDNKNRPRELSSKVGEKKQQPKVRCDPRFEETFGTFNEKKFRKAYKFLDKIREKEKEIITKKLKEERDPEKKEILKKLKQRIDNQDREKQKNEQEQVVIHDLQQKAIERTGRPYLRKSEVKAAKLVHKYKQFKKGGKLEKYIEKKTEETRHKRPKKGLVNVR